MTGRDIPLIDPRVRYEGMTTLRRMNSQRLRELTSVVVIQDQGQPVAVLMPYQVFIEVQSAGRPQEK